MTRNTLFMSWPLSQRRELAEAIDAYLKARKAYEAARRAVEKKREWAAHPEVGRALTAPPDLVAKSHAAYEAKDAAWQAMYRRWPKGRGLVLYKGKLLDDHLNVWSGVVPLDDDGGRD
jgi:hypothetical protein